MSTNDDTIAEKWELAVKAKIWTLFLGSEDPEARHSFCKNPSSKMLIQNCLCKGIGGVDKKKKIRQGHSSQCEGLVQASISLFC